MTQLSWIGSLAICIRQVVGPLYAWLRSKMDDRYTIALGGLVTCLSLMLASITHEVCECEGLTDCWLNTHHRKTFFIDLAAVDHPRNYAGSWHSSRLLSLH